MIDDTLFFMLVVGLVISAGMLFLFIWMTLAICGIISWLWVLALFILIVIFLKKFLNKNRNTGKDIFF